jgi:hypothetical protein
VGCTVPYHRTLRNCINKVIEESKVKYPGHYIQAEKFQLKVSKMKGGAWTNNVDTIPLPDSVLDLSRLGPSSGSDGKPATSRKSTNENMDADESGGVQG